MADERPYKVIDFKRAKDNLDSLKSKGSLSARDHRRLSKGIANIQQGQAKGYVYDVDSSNNRFTAKDAEGNDARGKFGGMKGPNIVEGRKTSKAMSYLVDHLKKSEVQSAPNSGGDVERIKPDFKALPIVFRPNISYGEQPPQPAEQVEQKKNGGVMKYSEGGLTISGQRYNPTKTGQMKTFSLGADSRAEPLTPSWIGKYKGKPMGSVSDRAKANFTYSPKVPLNTGAVEALPKTPPIQQERISRELDTMGTVNAGLGLVGATSMLTAREPKVNRTPAYRAKIRPYSGDQEMLDSTVRSIDESAYKANEDIKNTAGSNLTGYLTGRAMIESNRNEGIASAHAANSQIMREDRNRYDQAVENENQINHGQIVTDQKEKEARDFQRYLTRTQTGQAMAQNSLSYINAKQADEKNKAVALKMMEEKIKNVKDGSRYTVLASAIASGGFESLNPEMKQLYYELMGRTDTSVPANQNGGRISYFRRGGKIDATTALANSSSDLKKMKTEYAKFVSDASREQIRSFGDYIKQINRINRVKITRN